MEYGLKVLPVTCISFSSPSLLSPLLSPSPFFSLGGGGAGGERGGGAGGGGGKAPPATPWIRHCSITVLHHCNIYNIYLPGILSECETNIVFLQYSLLILQSFHCVNSGFI